MEACLKVYDGPSLITILWGLASLGIYRREIYDASLSYLMTNHLKALPAGQLPKLASAYSVARSGDPEHRSITDAQLYTYIKTRCMEEMPTLTPGQLTELVCSFSWAAQYDHDFYEKIADLLAHSAPELTAEQLTSLAVVYSSAQHSNQAFLQAIADSFLAKAEEAPDNSLLLMAQTVLKFGYYHDALFKLLMTRALTYPDRFGSTNLLEVIRLMSSVEHKDAQFFETSMHTILHSVGEMLKLNK